MYGCDCDSVKREQVDAGRRGDVARGVLEAVDRVTGLAPPTCPWRAMSEAIVREVLAVSWACGETNALGPVLGPDPDAKLVQAIGVYTRAKFATRADEQRIQDEDDERERNRRQALANAQRGRRA